MKYIAALLLFVVLAQATQEVLHATSPTAISGSYIVILKEGSGVARRDAHIEKLKAQISATNDASEIAFTYNIGTMIGFAAKLSPEMLKIELADPDVDYVEADQIMTAVGTVTQEEATWGLGRVAATTAWDPNPDPYENVYPYTYDETAGAGVNVYVIDTGILTSHQDFGGRATFGFSAFGDNGIDGNGHGTHCAGTIGGTTYGIAKKANLIAVKVLSDSGSGSTSGVVAGINFVTQEKNKAKSAAAVASMSLGGGLSTSLDNAVKQSVAAGVVYSIAAGNSWADACFSSPARAGGADGVAITVGASNITDAIAWFSNWGKCVDVFAPGVNITSDWIDSSTATKTISGTSMACPHVSGVLALKLGVTPTATPASLKKDYILAHATANAVKDVVYPKPGVPSSTLPYPKATTRDLLHSPAPVPTN